MGHSVLRSHRVKESEPKRSVWVWEIPQDFIYGFFCFTSIEMKPFPRTIDSGYSLSQYTNGWLIYVREVVVGEGCFYGDQRRPFCFGIRVPDDGPAGPTEQVHVVEPSRPLVLHRMSKDACYVLEGEFLFSGVFGNTQNEQPI